jgi:hypothetical protein
MDEIFEIPAYIDPHSVHHAVISSLPTTTIGKKYPDIESSVDGSICFNGKDIKLTADTITINGIDFGSLVTTTEKIKKPPTDELAVRYHVSSTLLNTMGLNSEYDDIDLKPIGKIGSQQADFESFMTGFEQGISMALEQLQKFNAKRAEKSSTELD